MDPVAPWHLVQRWIMSLLMCHKTELVDSPVFCRRLKVFSAKCISNVVQFIYIFNTEIGGPPLQPHNVLHERTLTSYAVSSLPPSRECFIPSVRIRAIGSDQNHRFIMTFRDTPYYMNRRPVRSFYKSSAHGPLDSSDIPRQSPPPEYR